MQNALFESAFQELKQEEVKKLLKIKDKRTVSYKHHKDIAINAFLSIVKIMALKWFRERLSIHEIEYKREQNNLHK